MNDLTALILTVAPGQPLTTPSHLGRAIYSWWLAYINAADPEFAETLHADSGPKPFTCSTLVGGKRQDTDSTSYSPDQPAWFRLTGLNAAVSDHLQRLAAAPPPSLVLGGAAFNILSTTLDPAEHEWAGQTNYEAFASPFLLAKQPPHYRLGLHFASPTTFRTQGRSQPIPMANWVFGSLLNRWHAFSPVRLPPEVRRFADECTVLSQYRLSTRAVPMKEGIVQMGCVGRAWYAIINRDRYWSSMLNLLAAYSFYAGVGYQTTAGFGQVRPIN